MAEPLNSMILNNYRMALIPGYFEGVSSARISGFNIGINKNIENKIDRVKAAWKFVEYAISIDFQKELFMASESVPAIYSLFDDEEVRNKRGAETCDMFKNVQHMKKPNVDRNEIPDYGDKFYLHSKNYLYNGVSINDTINRLENISKFYYISLDSNDSFIGLISIIIIPVISLIMLFSIVFLFRDNFIPFFKFLPSEMNIIVIIGVIMTLCTSLTNIGPITVLKCQLKIFLFAVGFTFTIIPVLAQLIINFPDHNNISNWVKKHKYLFLLLFLLIDITLFSFSLLKPYFKNQIIIPEEDSDRKNFKVCKMNFNSPVILFSIDIITKISILIISLFLIFIEWNIKNTFYDIRLIVNTVYSTMLLLAIFIIIDIIDISDYKLIFIIQIIITSFISISNYLFLYGFKLILAVMHKNNVKLSFIKKFNDNFINNNKNFSSNNSGYCKKHAMKESQNTSIEHTSINYTIQTNIDTINYITINNYTTYTTTTNYDNNNNNSIYNSSNSNTSISIYSSNY